jgi:hypothetical protein
MNTVSKTRLVVQFIPKHWIGNHAVPSSPAEAVDATAALLGMAPEEIRGLRDGNAASDNLVDPIARGHFGPYAVLCEEAVSSFFGVADVRQVTQGMLDEKRAMCEQAALDGDNPEPGEPRWLMVCGQEKRTFACRAPSIEQAIAHCTFAFPGLQVVSATCAAL